MTKELILILTSGILVKNYVLQQFLGICPFLGVSKKFNQASGMGIAVTFVMLCATAVSFVSSMRPAGWKSSTQVSTSFSEKAWCGMLLWVS